MKWIVKLPDGSEYASWGANPEEAAKFVDHALARPTKPGQKVVVKVRHNLGSVPAAPTWESVTLYAECVWTAHPLRVLSTDNGVKQ